MRAPAQALERLREDRQLERQQIPEALVAHRAVRRHHRHLLVAGVAPAARLLQAGPVEVEAGCELGGRVLVPHQQARQLRAREPRVLVETLLDVREELGRQRLRGAQHGGRERLVVLARPGLAEGPVLVQGLVRDLAGRRAVLGVYPGVEPVHVLAHELVHHGRPIARVVVGVLAVPAHLRRHVAQPLHAPRERQVQGLGFLEDVLEREEADLVVQGWLNAWAGRQDVIPIRQAVLWGWGQPVVPT